MVTNIKFSIAQTKLSHLRWWRSYLPKMMLFSVNRVKNISEETFRILLFLIIIRLRVRRCGGTTSRRPRVPRRYEHGCVKHIYKQLIKRRRGDKNFTDVRFQRRYPYKLRRNRSRALYIEPLLNKILIALQINLRVFYWFQSARCDRERC